MEKGILVQAFRERMEAEGRRGAPRNSRCSTPTASASIMLPNLKRGTPMAEIIEFLTVGEASEYSGVLKDSLRRWDRARKFKARRNPVTR